MGNAVSGSAPGSSSSLSSPPPPLFADTPTHQKTVISGHPGETELIIPHIHVKPTPRSLLGNPGNFEDLHKKCKDVLPVNFEGFRFMLSKPLSHHFQVSHTINMGAMHTGYRFGATYVGKKMLSASEAYPVVLGEIEPSGNMNAQIIHVFGNNLRSRLVAQYDDGKLAGVQLTNDYKGRDFTASLTLGQIDILRNSGIVVGQYLQSVTKSLALGAELMYQKGAQIPGGQISMLSLGGKFTGSDFLVAGSLGMTGVHLSYYQKCSDQLQVGVDMDTSLRTGESTGSIGYAIEVPKSHMTFRGSVDSNFIASAVLERRLFPLPASLAFSAIINHKKAASQFGIGLMIGT